MSRESSTATHPGQRPSGAPTSVVVLDEGTTSTRAVLIGVDSTVLLSESRPIDISTSPDGAVEQDAGQILDRSIEVLRSVLAQATDLGERVGALAIAAQRTTTVLWDARTGMPVAPVYSWQDSRNGEALDALRPSWAERYPSATGLNLVGGSHLHLATMLRDDTLRGRAVAGELMAGTIESFLIWRLSGGPDGGKFATSASCAGSSGLFDVGNDRWYEEFLAAMGIPVGVLPEVLPEDGAYGVARAQLIGADLPITGVVGDQQAALVGHGGIKPGSVKCTHGTGSFVDFHAGTKPLPPEHGIDCRIGWRTAQSSSFVLEGHTFVTGSGVDWLVHGLGVLSAPEQLDATYTAADPRSGVLCVPALAGIAAPHWDTAARGMMVGLNRGTTQADVVRGFVDGVAHTVADLVEAMGAMADMSAQVLCVDGGLALSDTLLQAQADFMQAPVVRAADPQSVTARGAAFVAGVAVGIWEDLGAATARVGAGTRFEPRMSEAERSLRREAWLDATQRALGWTSPRY